MTNRCALIRLHALEAWRRLPLAGDGRPYGPGFFATRDWEGTLARGENRRVSLRLAALGECLGCQTPMAPGSTGDHLVPKAEGGPDGAQNYLPLCRSCNSSKGKRDLLEWWVAAGKAPVTLTPDALCAYTRLRFKQCEAAGTLDDPARPALVAVVEGLAQDLPPRHREAVFHLGTVALAGTLAGEG